MNKKAFEPPVSGIFYLVPDPKTPGEYTLYVEHEEDGKDTLHLYLWNRVAGLLASRFKVSKEAIEDAYTGIPRGRITATIDDWVVAHGGDFPMEKYRGKIISEFTLDDAETMGKVRWVVAQHEKMGPAEQATVEAALHIKFTKTGWTRTGKRS